MRRLNGFTILCFYVLLGAFHWKVLAAPCSGGETYSPMVDLQTGNEMSEPFTIQLLNYSNNANCTWSIEPKSNDTIEGIVVDFIKLDTEQCCDFVKVYNAQSNELYGSYSGDTMEYLTLPFSSARLIFVSDGSVTKGGFEVQWRAFGMSACNGGATLSPHISMDQSTGMSMGNEIDLLDYGNNDFCSWLLLPTSNGPIDQISIEFVQFQTENCCDYLEVYDVAQNDTLFARVDGMICQP